MDKNLRLAILIAARSYNSRGDYIGELIGSMLESIIKSAELLDQVEENVEEEEPQ